MFARWGRFVYRFRWAVLAGSALMLAISVGGVVGGGALSSGGPTSASLEADRAATLYDEELGGGATSTSPFDLIFSSPTLPVSDPAFESAVNSALAPIQGDPRIASMVDPYNAPTPQEARALTSKDGRQALVVIDLEPRGTAAYDAYDALRSEVRSDTLSVTGTGFVPINEAFNRTLESDLHRAETVTLPATLVLLVIIFASLVAAGLPLGVGVLTILGGLAGTFVLNRFTDVSQYALNIVTLIGLAVAIDYSLFVVSRFREELPARGGDRQEALGATVATAGRAITFSGLTVAIGLSAMLFYPGTFLAAMGAAGAISVALAVIYGLTFLPALLAVLGPRVDLVRVPLLGRPRPGRGLWFRTARGVMRRPWLVLLPTVGFLALAATPFLSLRLASGGPEMLPQHVEARRGYDRLVTDFPGQNQTTVLVVIDYPRGSPLTASRIGGQYDLEKRIAAIPGVLQTSSIYDLQPGLTRAQAQALFSGSPASLPPPVGEAVRTSVGRNIVVIDATTNLETTSDGARAIVRAIRSGPGVSGGRILVGGETAYDLDLIQFIVARTPLAVGFVLLITYLVLFLLTGSVVLPLKAVVMNVLSIGASFGALVWIFQQGHLAGQLGFTPQSIDPSIPVILFSIVFGMSMDYEVLLVSRIHEEYLATGDNPSAVAEGLARSGRLITGAAAIMVTVFLGFGLAEVVIIKSIGIGLAIAVAIDATIVRALVVPAVMRLLGDLNWWAPDPLRWLHGRAGLADFAPRRAASPLAADAE